jgi:hexosaminidase
MNGRLFCLLCCCFLRYFPVSAQPALIPAPLKITGLEGRFVFPKIISASDTGGVVGYLFRYIEKEYGLRVPVTLSGKNNRIELLPGEGNNEADESYKIRITKQQVQIRAGCAGRINAIHTLLQLLQYRNNQLYLPCIEIEDAPRFAYRGFMLDVSRHFFTTDEIKSVLDIMAYYKLNVFHWHLTDDQGWRLEIKSRPRLTSVGAWRVPRIGDFNRPEVLPPQPGEKAADGGYYTQEQVKEIVRYAAERNIRVLPEIDVPGHCMAAIAAYPELCCTRDTSIKVNPGSSFAKWFPNGTYEMYVDNTLNPADENVYRFLEDVFREVAALFPYKYIHVGGDECFKGFWQKDTGIQTFLKKHQLENTRQLQAWFMRRVKEIVQQNGKKMIGWDEVTEENPGNDFAVMNRFGEKSEQEQLQRKMPVVMVTGKHGLYFDYAQSASPLEPINHGGNAPVSKIYAYDPVLPGLSAEAATYIMGVEGCLWTEHVKNMSKLGYMSIPRLMALSEMAWSAVQRKQEKDFFDRRLPVHLAYWDAKGWNFRVPTAFPYLDTTFYGNRFRFTLQPPVAGAKIYYTLGGRPPGDTDDAYQEPLQVNLAPGQKTELQTIVVTPGGRRSLVSRTVMINNQQK